MTRFTLYLASALIAFFHLAVPLAFSQEIDPRLKQILADWEKMRGEVQRVRFCFKCKTVYPNRSLPMVPGQPGIEWPLDREGNATVLYCFSDGRYRYEYSGRQGESGTDTWEPFSTVVMYDGKNLYTVPPPDKRAAKPIYQPDLVIDRNFQPWWRGPESLQELALRLVAGIPPDLGVTLVGPGMQDLQAFHFLRETSFNDRPCLIFQRNLGQMVAGGPSWLQEYWIVPGLHNAIVRDRTILGDMPKSNIEIDYSQTKHGWLPKNWELTIIDEQQKVRQQTKAEVTLIEVDSPLPDDLFKPKIEPGMKITASAHYRVLEDGTWLNEDVAPNLHSNNDYPGLAEILGFRGSPLVWGILLVGVPLALILLAAVVCLYWHRRRIRLAEKECGLPSTD
jgi:hypothetical protein